MNPQWFAQYLDGLDKIATRVILENVEDFKKELLSPKVTDVLDVWYSEKGCLVYVEYDERAVVTEEIESGELSTWLAKHYQP